MRKFTKILTVLLAVMLVFGIAAIVTTANDETNVYQIADKDGNVIITSTDAGKLKDDITAVLADYDGAYVKLLADATFPNTVAGISVGAGKTVDFDFNGYDATLFTGAYSSFFDMYGAGSSINIYSSQPGSVFDKYSYHGNAFRGYAVVRANQRVDTTINFGNGTNNLTINSPVLFDVDNGKNYNGTHTVTLNIDGGIYSRAHQDSAGLIIIRDKVNVTVKNATLVSTHSGIFCFDKTRTNAKLTATVEDSVIYAAGAMVQNLNNASMITVTNSFIDTQLYATTHVSKPFDDADSRIILGEGTKYTDRFVQLYPVGGQIITAEGTSVLDDAVIADIKFDYTTGSYSGAVDSSNNATELDKFVITTNTYDVETTFNLVAIPSADNTVNVTFGEPGDAVYATGTAMAGTTPAHPTLAKDTVVKVNGTPKILAGWATTKGATKAENVVAVKGQPLQLYPVYGDIAFEMTSGETVIKYGSSTETLYQDYNTNASKYSEITIKLYADYNVPLGSNGKPLPLIPPANTTLNFDVNGNTINNITTANHRGYIFSLQKDGCTLNLYSSAPGGMIKVADINGKTINGSSVVYSATFGNTINIGNGTQNLTVIAPTILDIYGIQGWQYDKGTVELNATPNGKIVNITVDGGMYISHNADSLAQIIIRHNANVLVKNATFVTEKDNRVLLSCDDRFFFDKGINVTFENCNLKGKTMIGILPENATVTFNDCNLYGDFTFTKSQKDATTIMDKGTIIFGEGTKYNLTTIPEIVKLASGCVYFDLPTEEKLAWGTYAFTGANSVWDESSLTTWVNMTETLSYTGQVYDEDNLPQKIKVSFIESKTNIPFYTTELYPGEKAVFDYDYPSTRIDGWFVNGISGWSKTPGGEMTDDLIISKSNCNFYAVYGKELDLEPLFNYETTTGVTSYLYVPVPAEDSGITVDSIWEKGQTTDLIPSASRCQTVTIDGVKYLRIVAWPGVYESRTSVYVINYTYNGVSARQEATVSPLASYFETLIDMIGDDEEENAELMSLIVNASEYVRNVILYVGKDIDGETDYDEILAIYGEDYLVTVDDETIENDYVYNVDGLDSALNGVTFVIGDGYRPLFAFDPIDAEKTTVKYSYNSYTGKVITWSATSKSSNHWNGLFANGGNIGVYDVRKAMNISVTYNGETYTGTYSLAAYITWLQGEIENKTENADAEALGVVKSLYAYSIASYNYKTRNAGK